MEKQSEHPQASSPTSSGCAYVDVHTHLTDERFDADREAVIERAVKAGFAALIVNGLEPRSNRQILEMARVHPVVKPALGIYPIDAVHGMLPPDFPLEVARFDIAAEMAFIRQCAAAGQLIAIGECGLDGHWLGADTFPEQERIFEGLLEIAMDHDLPVIIHTRKREERTVEILRHHGARKVDFHCYGGRVKLAVECAEKDRWWFSIPANARVNQAFKKMLEVLPSDRILTETDAPYLAPQRGERNEPANCVGTIAFLAELRKWSVEQAAERVLENFCALFGAQWIAAKPTISAP